MQNNSITLLHVSHPPVHTCGDKDTLYFKIPGHPKFWTPLLRGALAAPHYTMTFTSLPAVAISLTHICISKSNSTWFLPVPSGWKGRAELFLPPFHSPQLSVLLPCPICSSQLHPRNLTNPFIPLSCWNETLIIIRIEPLPSVWLSAILNFYCSKFSYLQNREENKNSSTCLMGAF